MVARDSNTGIAGRLRVAFAAATLGAGALAAACVVDAPDPVGPSLPALQIAGPDTIRGIGVAAQYAVNVTGTQALQVHWSSLDPHVLADGEAAGSFVAHAGGTATIRATSGSRSADKTVVVYVETPRELRLYAVPDTLLTSVADTVHLIAVLRLASGEEVAPGDVEWASSDTDVATVTAGVVVARGDGRAVITARSEGLEASVAVRVELAQPPTQPAPPTQPDPPVRLLLGAEPDTLLTSTADTVQISVMVELESGARVAPSVVSWASSDAAVARVEGGRVVGLATGRAVITARADGLEAGLAIRVSLPSSPPPPPPVTVTLLPQGDTVITALEETLRLEVRVTIGTGTPFTPEPASVEWRSSAPAVVAVQDGVAVAVGNGTATITARTHDGEASIAVRVAQVATDLTLGSTLYEIAGPGGTVQLDAVARDRRGHAVAGVSMDWSSSYPQRIAVNGSGVASAPGWGSATVQVTALGQTRSAMVRVSGGSAPVVEHLRAGITPVEGEAAASYAVVTLELADAQADMDSLRVTLLTADGGVVATSLTLIEQGTGRLPFTLHAAEAGAATRVRVDAYDAAGHHTSQTRVLQVSPGPGSPVIDWIHFERAGSDSIAVEIDVTDHQRDVDMIWLAGFDAQGGWTFLHAFEIEPAPYDEWTAEVGLRAVAVASTHRFAIVVSDAAGNLSLLYLWEPQGTGGGLGSIRPWANRVPGVGRAGASEAAPEPARRRIPRARPRARSR